MAATRALGLLVVSLSGCATPPSPLPPPTAVPPPTTEAKPLEPAVASPAPSSAMPSPPATSPPATSPSATSAIPSPAPTPAPEPDSEYSFSDFKGASGFYYAVHCLPPPSSGPKVAAAAPHAACEATWHKVELHAGFSGEQSKKKKRALCCYRIAVCEFPVD